MPKNPNTDDPNQINEIEFNVPKESIRVHYMDYHISTAFTGTYQKDDSVLNNLTPSYAYPETIKCIGHWNDAGFDAKLKVIKTKLNTQALLLKYLGYIPTYLGATLDCAMYDYFLEVVLNTGFVGSGSTKKCVIHLHRGFSRHQFQDLWYGDWYGNIEDPNVIVPESIRPLVASYNSVGPYEHAFKFGFNYTLKGTRTDNIYSNPLKTVNSEAIPPLKHLDIYETFNTPIISKFEITAIEPYTFYKPIRRIQNITDLPPNINSFFTNVDEYVLGNVCQFTYSNIVAPIERAKYAMNLYVKTIGEDGRQKDPADGIYKYQGNSPQIGYVVFSEGGRSIFGYFDLPLPSNLILQNKDSLNVGSSSVATRGIGNVLLGYASNDRITCRYDIFNLNSTGYIELTDQQDSTLGAFISAPKILKLQTNVYHYDRNETFGDTSIRFNLFSNDSPIPFRTGWSGRDPNNLQEQIFKFYYDLKTHFKLYKTIKDTISITTETTNYNRTNDLNNKILLQGFNKYLTIKPMAKNSTYQSGNINKIANPYDDTNDVDVYFKSSVQPAFKYNRLPTLSTIDNQKINDLVVLNAPNQEPINSINPDDYYILNSYRYLKYRINFTFPPIAEGGNINQTFFPLFRVTFWEASGTGVTQRYFIRRANIQPYNFINNLYYENYLDLMFPQYPGKKYDDQDDPYPRMGNDVNSEEKANGACFGCGRILRIDVTADYPVSEFTIYPVIDPVFAGVNKTDILRFNPPSGSDSNLKQYKAGDQNISVRRLLYLEHQKKPEEEFDLTYNKSTGKSALITIQELVNNLNNNHPGLNCAVEIGSENVLATYTQGHHFNLNQDIDQAYKNITSFYNSVDEIQDSNNTIYFSDIYQGIYLDFPPYVQDFFETIEADTFKISDTNLAIKRRSETAPYHLIVKGTCSTRSVIAGIMQVDQYLPEGQVTPDLLREVRYLEILGTSPNYQNDFLKGHTYASDYDDEDGFFRSGKNDPNTSDATNGLGLNYDYGINSYDQLKNYAHFIFQAEEWLYKTKNLPNKLTRIVFSRDRTFIPNPENPEITLGKNFFTAVGSKIDSQTSVLLGESFDDLNPFTDIRLRNDRATKNGSARIINISGDSSYTFYDINKINEFYPRVFNQNLPNNISYNIFAESYKYPSSGTAYTTQGIVYSNLSSNNKDSWNYFNFLTDPARLFRNTERNSYQISPNFQDVYCLGDYNGALILQVASFDLIKNQSGDVYPNINKSIYQVDGNFSKNSNFPKGIDITENANFPELTLINERSAWAFKYSSMACIDVDVLVFFYSLLSFDLNFITCKQIYYNTLINNKLGAGNILFESSDFCTSPNYLITNYDFIYDNVQKLIKGVFLLTTGPDVNNVKNHIIYTEFDFNSGTIIKPRYFHYVAGEYDSNLFKSDRVFVDSTTLQTTLLPYHKPAIYLVTYSELKGYTGIFYKNKGDALLKRTIKPFNYTLEEKNVSSQ